MKFLIVGLGNIGSEYSGTRHNIGFDVVTAFAQKHNGIFNTEKYADYCGFSFKGKQIHIIKPTTYMNLSGKAVRYWLQQLKLTNENLIVVTDDIAIDFAKIRIRPSGSDGGHNGLKSIQELLQTNNYPRVRVGLGNNYSKGRQADFVLDKWTSEEQKEIPALIDRCVLAIETLTSRGLSSAMNDFNK